MGRVKPPPPPWVSKALRPNQLNLRSELSTAILLKIEADEGAYYVEVLRKLRANLVEKRPGKLHRGILFHHDNAPAHSSRIVRDVLREFSWKLLPHPPYSPDLAPSDFFLFLKLKEHLKGVYLNNTNEAKQVAKTWLTKWSDYFKNGKKGWKHRLEKCIDLDGDYVEK